jgi:hypothetical protein
MRPTLFQGTSSSPQIQSAWSTQPMSSSSIFSPPASYSAQIPSPLSFQQPYPGYPPTHSQPSSVNPAIQAMQAPSSSSAPPEHCLNCFGTHRNRDCPAPFCRHCSSSWSSITAPGYHLFVTCQNLRRPKQPRDQPSSRTGGSPAKAPYDYRRSRKASVNAMTGAPQSDLDAMAAYI